MNRVSGHGTKPLVLGHRGYRARCPENTLRGFRAAFESGADGVECDLQRTADGRYVLIHDPSTDRTAGQPGDLRTMGYDELRQLDVGKGEHVPELGELLAALPPGKYLDLELKAETLTPEDSGPIIDILAGRLDRGSLMISSFEPALLAPFRGLGYAVGLIVGEKTVSLGAPALAALLFRLRPQWINLPIQTIAVLGRKRARRLFGVLRALGLSLLFWTVNDAEDAEAVRDYARIIVTDEVERIVSALSGG